MLQILLLFEILLSITSGIGGYIYEEIKDCEWYIPCQGGQTKPKQGGKHADGFCPVGAWRAVFLPGSFLLIYMYMVPIALYVSSAMVKVIQAP